MKRRMILSMLLAFATVLAICTEAAAATETGGGYAGISAASPDWVAELDAAKDAQQVFAVAALHSDATVAWISLHEKQDDGTWRMVMTTPGFIGKNGLGKTREGDAKTPIGVFRFNRAFGIADDPGCAIPYVKVDELNNALIADAMNSGVNETIANIDGLSADDVNVIFSMLAGAPAA